MAAAPTTSPSISTGRAPHRGLQAEAGEHREVGAARHPQQRRAARGRPAWPGAARRARRRPCASSRVVDAAAATDHRHGLGAVSAATIVEAGVVAPTPIEAGTSRSAPEFDLLVGERAARLDAALGLLGGQRVLAVDAPARLADVEAVVGRRGAALRPPPARTSRTPGRAR
jgi:hypothetical protein